jgi:hypothetical protein
MTDFLQAISSGIDLFFVDLFFADDVFDDAVSGSRLLLGVQTRRVFGDGVVYEPVINVKIDLPHTNKRLKILFESDVDETEQSSNIVNSAESVQYSTAIRYVIGETSRWKYSWDNGVRLNLPPTVFSRLRARRNISLGDWSGRFTQELFWYTDDGVGEKTLLNLGLPLNEELLVRWNTNYTYLLDNDYFTFSHVFGLYQELSSKDAVAYQVGLAGDTIENDQVKEYFSRIRYRRSIYKKWIFFEIAPDIRYLHEDKFRPSPGFLARLEVLFGGKRK